MATLSQLNTGLGLYNRAITGGWAGGGSAGSSSLWGDYNRFLDQYGIGNGSTAGVPGAGGSGAGVAGGSGGTTGSSVILGGTGSTGGPINFNLNPQPQSGSGTFGAVPGAIGAPPSIWEQTQAIPGMANLTGQNTSLIGSQMSGNLSPSTISSLTDSAAARGVQLGQGGSTGLTNEILLKTLGLTHEQLQQQGQQNYLSFLGASGQQQQNPQLLAEIASRNATMAAAPNPTAASQYLMGLSRGSGGSSRIPNYANILGGGGGSGGGYGGYGNLLSNGGTYSDNSGTVGSGGLLYNPFTGAYPGGPQQDTGDNAGAQNRVDNYFDSLNSGADQYSSQPDQPNEDDQYLWE